MIPIRERMADQDKSRPPRGTSGLAASFVAIAALVVSRDRHGIGFTRRTGDRRFG
jgi:hypothetical protein